MTHDESFFIFEKYFYPIVNVSFSKLSKAALDQYPMTDQNVFETEHNNLAIFKYVYFQSIIVAKKFNADISIGYNAATGILAALFIQKLGPFAFDALQAEATDYFKEFNHLYQDIDENDKKAENKSKKVNWVKAKSKSGEEIKLNCDSCDKRKKCDCEDLFNQCEFLSSSLKDIIINNIPYKSETVQENNSMGLCLEISDCAFNIYKDTIKSALNYYKVR